MADSRPMPNPETKRATSSQAICVLAMKIRAATISSPAAASMMRRRPIQSLTCPNSHSATITPTA